MAAGNRKSSNKRKTQTKKERMAEMEKAQAFRVEVTLWIVVAAALLLFISNLGFGGAVGKTVSGFLFGMFGLMAYVLPVLLLVGSFFAVSNRGNKLAAVKLIAAIVFLVFLCTFMGLAMNGNDRIHPLDAYTYCAERHTGGGIIGGCLAYYMCQAFGLIGSFIIDIIVLIVCMVLITERSALRGMQKGGKKVYESAKESNEKYREYREYRAQERKERRMDHKVSGVSIDTRIEEKGKKNKKRKSDEMGELSAPAFDMMPDTTVSPMPEKNFFSGTSGGFRRTRGRNTAGDFGGFYAGYFSTGTVAGGTGSGTYCRIGTGQRRIKAGRKNTKKEKRTGNPKRSTESSTGNGDVGFGTQTGQSICFSIHRSVEKGRREKVCQY